MRIPFLLLSSLLAILAPLTTHSEEATLLTYEEPYNEIANIVVSSKSIVLNSKDGSRWFMDKRQATEILATWKEGGSFAIFPISHSQNTGRFALKNTSTQSFIFAKLDKAPFANTPLTISIHGIDDQWFAPMTVTLEKGREEKLKYRINSNDRHAVRWWDKGDIIIVGSNMSPTTQINQEERYILINHKRKETARAEIIGNSEEC